jgi:outer membrane protein OmpA-like peptidoglycan-associated protein
LYTVSGTDVDTFGNTGSWSYALTVNPEGGVISQTNSAGAVNAGTGFGDTIGTTGNSGAVTFTTVTGTAFTVSSSGVVSALATLPPGIYTVSGTDVDTYGNAGTWTYTLTVNAVGVTPSPPVGGVIVEGNDSGTVNVGNAFGGSIPVTDNQGPVTFTTTSTGNDLTVSSSGAISSPGSLAKGVYTVSGVDSDGFGDTGVWSFTLTVVSTSSTFTVGAPVPGPIGGKYTPVITASGATVTITTMTPAICTVANGVVTYIASGTCTLRFSSDASAGSITQHIAVRAPARVHLTLFDFANNKWTLTSSMKHRLQALAATIKRNGDTHININGYASSTGKTNHNEVLSRRRAAVVAKYLLAELHRIGATVTTFTVSGHGASVFVSTNTASSSNRRTSIYGY